jgi:hypothetical protein
MVLARTDGRAAAELPARRLAGAMVGSLVAAQAVVSTIRAAMVWCVM